MVKRCLTAGRWLRRPSEWSGSIDNARKKKKNSQRAMSTCHWHASPPFNTLSFTSGVFCNRQNSNGHHARISCSRSVSSVSMKKNRPSRNRS